MSATELISVSDRNDAGIHVLKLPHLNVQRERVDLVAPNGATILEIVKFAFPGLDCSMYDHIQVVIGEHKIKRQLWHLIRPRGRSRVILRIVAENDVLRSVLTVAIIVAALAVGQYYAPAIAGMLLPGSITGFGVATATAGTLSIVAGVTTAAVAFTGIALLNQFIPVRGLPTQDQDTNVYGITGIQNSMRPGAVFPSILGRHRYAPPYATRFHTKVIGDDQYLLVAFEVGHGPYNFYDLKLGDTPIENYSGVDLELQYGYDTDLPITLIPEQVIEEQFSINLLQTEGFTVRFTAKDITRFSVDFTMLQGLIEFKPDGDTIPAAVALELGYRRVGDVAWSADIPITIVAELTKLFRRDFEIEVPVRGQYEVRIKRQTADLISVNRRQDIVTWTAIRGFRPESPFNFKKPTGRIAARIKTSNQLNGVVNNLNLVVALLCKDWDSGTQSWVVRETSNPASLFRHVLQGPANAYPKQDSQIDLVKLQEWHEFCTAKGLAYNRVHDYDATRLDVLRDIAAAGRATPHDDGIKWSVVIDKPQTIYTSAITPRNSFDCQGATPYVVWPDAYRVVFIDETNGYNQAERIVPFPGINPSDVNVTEDLSHPGITNPDLIFRETRRRQWELKYRPHTWKVSMDVENLVLSRGDLVPFNHDLLDRDHVANRVRRINGQNVTLDSPVEMNAGQSYAIQFRLGDGSAVRRSINTVAGKYSTVSCIGDISQVKVRNLAMFGTSVRSPVSPMLVKSIERGDNLTSIISLMDAAPEIDELTDLEVAPPWDGRVGEVSDLSDISPAPPVVAVSSDGSNILVFCSPGTGSAVLPNYYKVSHRSHGAGAYTEIVLPPGTVVASIAGYAAGESVDVKATAWSIYGVSSLFSAVVVGVVAAIPFADTTFYTADTTLYNPGDGGPLAPLTADRL